MATWAIGDVQGCYDPFRRLLDAIEFDPPNDTLWMVGDLVNRGPKSLKTLRYVRGLGKSAITVLGNHDLHLLAVANDVMRVSARFATLEKILSAPDGDKLIDWLRRRPLAHYDESMDTLLVHAGTHPKWTVRKTLRRAAEVEEALRGANYRKLLAKMYGNTPRQWSGQLSGYSRLRFIINTLTRMRMLTPKGGLNFGHAGPPWRGSGKLIPWYAVSERKAASSRIVFGHWSQLGVMALPNLISLDTGCVWGRQLTAVRLDTRLPRIVQVPGEGAMT